MELGWICARQHASVGGDAAHVGHQPGVPALAGDDARLQARRVGIQPGVLAALLDPVPFHRVTHSIALQLLQRTACACQHSLLLQHGGYGSGAAVQ